MSSESSPGDEHEQFTQWAISQGIVINGIAPCRFPGRGLGMVATRSIKKGEKILAVPHEAMFTINSIPSSFNDDLVDGTPLHARFAAFFTNGDAGNLEKYTLWQDTWPTREGFKSSVPVLWKQQQQISPTILPPSISGTWNTFRRQPPKHAYESPHQNLLGQQESRLRNAWERVVAAFPETDWDGFVYHWMIVNTRCFYYLMPGDEAPEDNNEAMAMLPVADYFNHADVVDDVRFDGREYAFRAAKDYDKGEEVYMSYGSHPNDFLFAEYGFFLDENDCEALYLDDIIFQDLSPSLQDELYHQQYYGNYQLTASGACYRTEIAACIKYMTLGDWQNYVLGYSTKGVDEKKSEAIIREWIGIYSKEASTAIATLKDMESSDGAGQTHGEKVGNLLKRWRQIEGLCQQALEAVSC